jgi:hypothetical protein
VILGLCFGTLATLSLYTLKYRDAAYAALHVPPLVVRIIRAVITFILVALVLVLFRATDLDDALLFYRDIFSLGLLSDLWTALSAVLFHHGTMPAMPVASAYGADWLLIAAIVTGDLMVRNGVTLMRWPNWLQVGAYNVGLGAVIYLWMTASVAPPFLYYKF